MRHRVYGKHLGRDTGQRDILFKTLTKALFTHGSIETSEAKAKAIKGLIDKVVNLAKNKKTQVKAQSFLNDKNLSERLIKEIVPKLGSRNSGYTSLVRLGTRAGDQTMMVRMSLIGAEELKPIVKESRVKSQESSKKKEPPVKRIEKASIARKSTKPTIRRKRKV